MRRLFLLAAVAALFLVALPVASASAAPPEGVTFEGDAFFAGPNEGTGFFSASGAAVEEENMCSSGTTTDVPGTVVTSGGQSPNGLKMRLVKEFVCDDGSGSFFVKLRVRLFNSGFTTFKWTIKGGTGAYANLKGHGTGFGSPLSGGVSVYDTYTGKIH